jgi:hypothetical protein
VTRFLATKKDLAASAEVLGAFFEGEDSTDAKAGALVVADAIDCLRTVRAFLTQKPGGRRG